MSDMEGVQYSRGNHEYMEGVQHRGSATMSTVGDISTMEGHHKYSGGGGEGAVVIFVEAITSVLGVLN